MKKTLHAFAIVVFGATLAGAPAGADSECDPGSGKYICGLSNPEDLVRLKGTPWVIAGNIKFLNAAFPIRVGSAPLHVINVETRKVTHLRLDESAPDWDRRSYPDCPGPLKETASGGLNAMRIGKGAFRLFATNAAGRSSIEIIDLSADDKGVHAVWRGCVLVPEGMDTNSVAPLPEGGLVVSGHGVATWHPGKGWKVLDGLKESNGVETSADGKWIYVALPALKRVERVSVADQTRDPITLDFGPDNLRWGEDGYLYTAGPPPYNGRPLAEVITDCMARPVCDEVGIGVARIDPGTLTATTLHNSDAIPGEFGASTAALQIGKTIWLGTVFGNRILILDRK